MRNRDVNNDKNKIGRFGQGQLLPEKGNDMKRLTCFKAYDIRGKLGEELNEDIAWRIGRAYGEFLKPKTIVLGGDVRLTSETLKLALAKGLQDAGVDVLDIGMSGTEEIYFATFHLGVDGGIEVTASHNPMDYNGMKLVREGLARSAVIPDCATSSVWQKPMTSLLSMKPNAVAISKSICVTLTLITCSVISTSKTSRRSSW